MTSKVTIFDTEHTHGSGKQRWTHKHSHYHSTGLRCDTIAREAHHATPEDMINMIIKPLPVKVYKPRTPKMSQLPELWQGYVDDVGDPWVADMVSYHPTAGEGFVHLLRLSQEEIQPPRQIVLDTLPPSVQSAVMALVQAEQASVAAEAKEQPPI